MNITFNDLENAVKQLDSDKTNKVYKAAFTELTKLLNRLQNQNYSLHPTVSEIASFIRAMKAAKVLKFEPLREVIGINLIDCICSLEEVEKDLATLNNNNLSLQAYFDFYNACRCCRVSLTIARCEAFLKLGRERHNINNSIRILMTMDDPSEKFIDLVLKLPLIIESLLIRLEPQNNLSLARKVIAFILEAPTEEESLNRLVLMQDYKDNECRREHIQGVTNEKLAALRKRSTYFGMFDSKTLKKYSRFERLHSAFAILEGANVDAKKINLFLSMHADNYYIDSYIEALAECVGKYGESMLKVVNLFLDHPDFEQCLQLLVACSRTKNFPVVLLDSWLLKDKPYDEYLASKRVVTTFISNLPRSNGPDLGLVEKVTSRRP